MSENKLGFGLMRLPLTDPNDETSLDLTRIEKMVDIFMKRGYTYFDTAWMYCGFESEKAAKKVLVDRYPRERFTLATKMHHNYFKTEKEREEIFEAQLKKTGACYFDYYLLHNVGAGSYEDYNRTDCFGWMVEKKEKGLMREIGFSYHDDAALLERVLTEHPEVDFVQLQLNYLDWDSEAIQSKKCYETAKRHGVPVVVMEPVKGGTLANVPGQAERLLKEVHPDWSPSVWALRFAAGLSNVRMVLSGMSTPEQVAENTAAMADPVPFNDTEWDVIGKVTDRINANIAVSCTGCNYCTEGCPQNIAIPKYFTLYNADLQEIDEKGWKPQEGYYENLAKEFGVPSDCVACGQCEKACPQHLPITELLKVVAEHFEN